MLQGFTILCQTGEEYLTLANDTLEKNPSVAKKYFEKAAALNNAEAHCFLANNYSPSDSLIAYHISQAAMFVDENTLFHLIHLYTFYSSKTSNPEFALQLYNAAKEKHPEFSTLESSTTIQILKIYVETQPFSIDEFAKKYKIKKDELIYAFSLQKLAEEASRGGRFGKPNLKIALQLILRDSFAPAELESAVLTVYEHYKKNEYYEFNICDHATSGYTSGFCSSWRAEQESKFRNEKIKTLQSQLKNNAGTLLKPAYNSASKFFKKKALNEEFHGGSGRASFVIDSETEQIENFLTLVEKVNNGTLTDFKNASNTADRLLNETYQKVIVRLKKSPISTPNTYEVTEEGVRSAQRLWISYRDASAALFFKIDPSISLENWKNWLTEIRTEELNKVLTLDKE